MSTKSMSTKSVSTESMPYHTNEGVFPLPAKSEDKTINVFRNFAGNKQSSLNITRDALQKNEDLDGYIARQIKDLKKGLPSYLLIKQGAVQLGQGDKAIDGIQVESRFIKDQITVYQRQAGFIMPEGKVLIVTLTCIQTMPEAIVQQWQNLLAGFTLRG